ncbi:Phosphoadenosine phosphosulphate reductase [uncultured Caudovirales phage]|uniref:Phosphoadenosine phosphosulphate reductase n=1 Tax=uncultured Caudovirales phage TaxID=2100421 RepID=A0A6J5MQZ5_9CAUD|nr:Phosphoadenosine phosphosulphate reductase [uncultured Caudovirales phage]
MSEGKEKLYIVMTSGGRTSMFLAKYIKENPKYKNTLFVFLNTGKEKEETLSFIYTCDELWDLNIIWLEAQIIKEKGIGTTYKVVDFETASRNGEPFEAMLEKYPLPNNMASNCTRELKQRPIESYIRDNFSDYDVFRIIGIRADEEYRKSNTAIKDNIIYPLCDDLRVDQKFIRKWWDMQSFDLQLKDYEGNCDLCFKKSLKKRLTIIKENTSVAEWWEKMENKYSSEAIPRFDLRTNKSVSEMKELAKRPFQKAEDLHELSKLQCDLFDYETDCFCKAN